MSQPDADRPDDVEDTDRGKQARGGDLGHPVIHRRGHEVRGDQPVRRQAADEERGREDPEGPRAQTKAEAAKRAGEGPLRRTGLRVVDDGAVGTQAEVRGPIPDEDGGDRNHDGERDDDDREHGEAPAERRGHPGEQREEHELAGRVGRREHPGDETALLGEPPRCDDRGERDRERAGGRTDHAAPEENELPRGGDEHRQPGRRSHGRERDTDHPPHAEALHERGRERRSEPEEQEVDGEGGRDRGPAPAELLLERFDQDRRAQELSRRHNKTRIAIYICTSTPYKLRLRIIADQSVRTGIVDNKLHFSISARCINNTTDVLNHHLIIVLINNKTSQTGLKTIFDVEITLLCCWCLSDVPFGFISPSS